MRNQTIVKKWYEKLINHQKSLRNHQKSYEIIRNHQIPLTNRTKSLKTLQIIRNRSEIIRNQ